MELFRENSQQTKDVDYFYKKAQLDSKYTFSWKGAVTAGCRQTASAWDLQLQADA